MQKLLLLCCAILLASTAGLAQSDVSTIADPSPSAAPSASPQASAATGLATWQLGLGYQFIQLRMPAQTLAHATVPAFTSNDSGADVSLTRFLTSRIGLEADVNAGFGASSTSLITTSQVLFVGGGARFAWRSHGRVQPWAHALAGFDHFSFTQTATAYGSNNSFAFIAGGGADFPVTPRMGIRVNADFVGSVLFSAVQPNWRIGAGLVFNF
jgi:hypothetical protein